MDKSSNGNFFQTDLRGRKTQTTPAPSIVATASFLCPFTITCTFVAMSRIFPRLRCAHALSRCQQCLEPIVLRLTSKVSSAHSFGVGEARRVDN